MFRFGLFALKLLIKFVQVLFSVCFSRSGKVHIILATFSTNKTCTFGFHATWLAALALADLGISSSDLPLSNFRAVLLFAIFTGEGIDTVNIATAVSYLYNIGLWSRSVVILPISVGTKLAEWSARSCRKFFHLQITMVTLPIYFKVGAKTHIDSFIISMMKLSREVFWYHGSLTWFKKKRLKRWILERHSFVIVSMYTYIMIKLLTSFFCLTASHF